MAKTRRLFSYKCKNGHVMHKWFPLGTRIDDHDETKCATCSKAGDVRTAYVVFAEAKAEEPGNDGLHP